jgi:methyl acetate hydrolase
MSNGMEAACQAVLEKAVTGAPRVPGVVAMTVGRQGTLYEGVAGQRVFGQGVGMTTDTVFAIFSTTKAITATAALQLVEEGKLDLDAPAKQYVPELGQVQVLEGFGTDGKAQLRAPKRDITARMLLLHTAGFAYDIFNENYQRMATDHGQPGVITATKAALKTALVHEPGEAWEYGSNIDWAGQVVEAIRGKRLGEVMQARIFAPLGMTSTAFTLTPDMRARLARIHQREADGSLTPLMEMELPQDPEVHMGGHGLYATVPDYCQFIRMWLNDGTGDHGRVLRPETVRMAERNGLGDLKIKGLPGIIPALSNAAEFFPGMAKSWALSFMVNDEDAPTGRPAGSLAWAGLANLYYWIDRRNGVGGFWATQILPFADPTSVDGYLAFETAVYEGMGEARKAA